MLTRRLVSTPRWAQITAVIFMVPSEGALIFAALTTRHPPLPFLGLLAVGGLFVLWRTTCAGVDGRPDELMVRNNLRTRHLPRTDITGFDLKQMGPAPLGQLFVTISPRDGRRPIPLNVTTRPLLLPRARERVTHSLTAVRRWHDDPSTPPGWADGRQT